MVARRWRRVLSVPQILYLKADEMYSDIEFQKAERLVLPMTDDDGEARFLLGFSLYQSFVIHSQRDPLLPMSALEIPCDQI